MQLSQTHYDAFQQSIIKRFEELEPAWKGKTSRQIAYQLIEDWFFLISDERKGKTTSELFVDRGWLLINFIDDYRGLEAQRRGKSTIQVLELMEMWGSLLLLEAFYHQAGDPITKVCCNKTQQMHLRPIMLSQEEKTKHLWLGDGRSIHNFVDVAITTGLQYLIDQYYDYHVTMDARHIRTIKENGVGAYHVHKDGSYHSGDKCPKKCTRINVQREGVERDITSINRGNKWKRLELVEVQQGLAL